MLINKCEKSLSSTNQTNHLQKNVRNVSLDQFDPRTKKILQEILQNDTFYELYQSTAAMFKFGIKIKAADPQVFKPLYGSHSFIQSIKFNDETKWVVLEYDSSISDREAKRLIIFELINATYAKQFDRLDADAKQGKISQEEYIEQNELYEWLALEESEKITERIDSSLMVNVPKRYTDFSDHLYLQKKSGHSEIYKKKWLELNKVKVASQNQKSISSISPRKVRNISPNLFVENSIEQNKSSTSESIEKSDRLFPRKEILIVSLLFVGVFIVSVQGGSRGWPT